MKVIPYLKEFIKYDIPWWQVGYCLRDKVAGRKGRREVIKFVYNQREFKIYSIRRSIDGIMWEMFFPILNLINNLLKRGKRK